MFDRNARIAGLVLAAGASSRLGRPKQLLEIDSVPLVRRTVTIALNSACDRVFAAVGANRTPIVAALADVDVDIIENDAWQEGIGSSIRCAIERICASETGYDAVLILLVDQYQIGAEHLDRLIEAFRERDTIVASEYSNALGVPALFPSRYFDELRNLRGDAGARKLIRNLSEPVVAVPCPDAAFDLDTDSDIRTRLPESI